MEITGNNFGAATYAMKKAMEMPNVLMELIQNTVNSPPEPQQPEALMAEAGKGNIIDLVV